MPRRKQELPTSAQLKAQAEKELIAAEQDALARQIRTQRMIGRPTKYDPSLCEELIAYYLRWEPYKTVNTMFGPKEIPNDLPTLAGFAIQIGVHRDTIHERSEGKDEEGHLRHPEFSDAIKKAKTIQEHYLVTNGLRGNFDKTFSIFFAKNVLGWKDVQHVEQNSTVSYNDLEPQGTRATSPAEARKIASGT